MATLPRAGALTFVALVTSGLSVAGCCTGPVGWSPPDADYEGWDAYRAPDAHAEPADAHGFFQSVDATAYRCGANAQVGQTCVTGECFAPWVCRPELDARLRTWTADGRAGRPYPLIAWPGGRCEGVCTVDAPGQCDRCTVCVARHGGTVGECFNPCSETGHCREGFACDVVNQVCVPSCTIVDGVDTCQFSTIASQDPWSAGATIVDRGADWPSHCNTETGRCATPGNPAATAGDVCEDDLDCEDDGTCLPLTPSGYCVRHGCNDVASPCREGDVCALGHYLGLRGRTCLNGCALGGETTSAQRIGLMGGHPTCGPGQACLPAARTGSTVQGACLPGNYNDVVDYNVGQECMADTDCWSPYGLGRCLMLDEPYSSREGRGVCSVRWCAMDSEEWGYGADLDRCRSTDQCVWVSEVEPGCVTRCESAADCPGEWACHPVDVFGDGSLYRTCWPACFDDTECAAGALCRTESGNACLRGDVCFCTRPPAVDLDAGAG